jgi:dTDP-glucose 4,6-dehydratase
MRLLVTGGLGFIGSNFILHMLKTYQDLSIINLDLITYAGNLENLVDVTHDNNRYTFVKGDITDKSLVNEIVSAKPDVVVNFAAESHVDRSILDASAFLKTNIIGVQTLLDCCREHGVGRFVQISTDEVYGSLGPEDPPFVETNHLKPNSPYSASKASADLLVRAYHKTYNMDVVITRCSNNYGLLQFPEKLIPLMITNAIQNQELPVYGDGLNVRDWIYVLDHCKAIDRVMRDGRSGRIYNIGGSCEYPNIEIVRLILTKLKKPFSLIKYVQDRPGHDRRYSMNATRITDELGWAPSTGFEEGIDATIKWYIENESWWRKIKSGEYLDYYEKWYGNL